MTTNDGGNMGTKTSKQNIHHENERETNVKRDTYIGDGGAPFLPFICRFMFIYFRRKSNEFGTMRMSK